MKPVIYHPEASAEFDAAAERYVFFRELNDCIRIVAVAHGARKPGYWARRK